MTTRSRFQRRGWSGAVHARRRHFAASYDRASADGARDSYRSFAATLGTAVRSA